VDLPNRELARATSEAPLHRIADVRASQAVTLRTISRRCGVPVRQLKAEEQGRCELTLSDLQRWAEALDVPVAELLSEPADSLTASVAQRAQLVRLMKTVEALRAHAESRAMRGIADRLRNQLLEIMPELDDVTAWPREAPRNVRGFSGRVIEYPFSFDSLEAGSDSVF